MMAKKELDKLSQEMIQCEADGFGVSYGKWKAVQSPYIPPEKEMRVCLFCGKLFEPKTPKQKYCDTVCSVANQDKKTRETSYIHKRNKKAKKVGVTDGERTRQAVS
jgi:hypothetical protein